MITILYLHETARISGAEQSLLNLIRHLDRRRFDPWFVLPEQGDLAEELRKLEVGVSIIRMPKVRYVWGVGSALKEIQSLIQEKNIRIIHSNSIRTHIYGALASRGRKVFTIWHQRNMLRGEIIDPDRLFSFLPSRIICNSRAIARRFEVGKSLPAKVRVVFNGVDINAFNPSIDGSCVRRELGIGLEEKVIGITSRFNLQKGHESFFHAAAIVLRNQDIRNRVRFLVVGGAVFASDKAREAYLKNMARKLGIQDRVIFTGFRTDMPQVYAAMDILVLASDAEACGRVVLEAMAAGKPVIGTDTGGTPEVIRDKRTGLLYPFGDSSLLAAQITYLIAHGQEAQAMGQEARKEMEQDFGIEKNVSAIQEIYCELTGETA